MVPRLFRWLLGCTGLLLVGGVLYTAGYHLVTAEWPWTPDSTGASDILREAAAQPRPTPAARPSHPAASAATQRQVATPAASAARPTAPVSATRSAPATASPGQGQMQEGNVQSQAMGGAMPYLVYLPPGYNDPANAEQHYPVVYLLHGSPGNYRDWSGPGKAVETADTLIGAGALPPMILVMPEGHTNLQVDSEWADGNPPAPQAETYLVRELVPAIDRAYRTMADRDHRAIGGLSSGAFGAVNMTLHHPEVFSTALGISGNYTAPHTILGKKIFKDAASVDYNTPISFVARLAHPEQTHVYLAVGTSDLLDNTQADTAALEQALERAGVPHQVQKAPGAHSWNFWSLHLVDGLRYFASVMAGEA